MDTEIKRQLAAILYADAVGYSRLTRKDEDSTVRMLGVSLDLLTTLIGDHNGKKVNEAGDAILAEFSSVIDSVRCAIAFQTEMAALNSGRTGADYLQYRIGLNLGELLYDRGDVYGDSVNIASRVQDLADPGGIAISGAVFEQVNGKVEQVLDDMGHHKVKNIEQSIHVYRVHLSSTVLTHQPLPLFDFDDAVKDTSRLITGRCLCGNVRYEINQPTMGASYCHCRMCQRASGDAPAIASAAFPAEAIVFIYAQPKYYQSSSIAMRGFCDNCGTSLTYRLTAPDLAPYISISILSLDNPENFAPRWHGGVESQLPWFDINDNLPRKRIDESLEIRRAWEYAGIDNPLNWDEKH